jgi:hypothetical protein
MNGTMTPHSRVPGGTAIVAVLLRRLRRNGGPLNIFGESAEQVTDALRARPAQEDDWTALRRSLDPVITALHENQPALAFLARDNPGVRARRAEQQQDWCRALSSVLAKREGLAWPSPLAASVMTAAAMSCLNSALEQWGRCSGLRDLGDLVDEAFVVMASV